MLDPLTYFWPFVESVTGVVPASAMSRWPKDSRERLLSAGLLKSAGTAKRVRCPACDRNHIEEVVAREAADGQVRYYVSCPDVMRAEVRPDELQQFAVDVPLLARSISASLSLSGPTKALASDRVWYCGRLSWHGALRDVLFGRGLIRKDGAGFRSAFALKTMLHPIVFVPSEIPPTDFWGAAAPTVIQLCRIAELKDGQMVLDEAVLTALTCQAEEGDAAASFVFRRYGEFWRLTFEGQTVYLKDSVGLAYIARLLNEPNRDIPAVSLLAARAGIDPRIASGSSGKLLEEADREKYQNLYREYTEELEEAKRNNDLGRIEKLQAQMDWLATEIARATGLSGRSREKTDADRVRKSVSMAVSRDIERIAGEHAALGRHLNAAINSGYTFRYAPEQPIDWLI
ncbi:MAG: hypothetical protein KatS3mg082_2750 [Nitrospiraceae bacterium]|nr:MAG: hypothetical protein KatS3mg082_2693 [Nitrospiraceae bacterium]GIW56346.1 MAG: hypothetical protein KatS3mg082_2750 [Nitrospiraceae bacterium]